MPEWRRGYDGVEDMTVAVMGCVVNGPGESKHASIGISLPGTGERPVAPVYEDGEKTVTLKGERIAEEFQELVEQLRRAHVHPTGRMSAADRRWPAGRCEPCEGGVAPLTRAAADELLLRPGSGLGPRRGRRQPASRLHVPGLLSHHELRRTPSRTWRTSKTITPTSRWATATAGSATAPTPSAACPQNDFICAAKIDRLGSSPEKRRDVAVEPEGATGEPAPDEPQLSDGLESRDPERRGGRIRGGEQPLEPVQRGRRDQVVAAAPALVAPERGVVADRAGGAFERLREAGAVEQTEIESLPRQRMDRMRRIAHQRACGRTYSRA